MQFRFGTFTLDTDTFVLREGDLQIHVEPLVFDLLRCLVARPGEVLSRDTIVAEVWDGRFVSDATVSSAVKSARRALGDNGEQQSYIRTVRGRGFQFVAEVSRGSMEEADRRVVVVDPLTSASAPKSNETNSAHLTSPLRIAVLPLFALSNERDLQVLGDAVAQEVILELSRLRWLFVLARGSSFKFRGQEIDLARTGEILGADYLVTGTILRAGDTCVITVELCHASGGNVLWADRITERTDELMLMRTALASRIVGALEPRIQLNETMAASRIPTDRLDAWAAYHRGLWHMYRFNERDNEQASELFSRATSLDPRFARAHAGLSFTHFQKALIGFSTDAEEERRRARRAADRAMEHDPLDPFVNLTLGRAEWISGNLEPGLSWMERAIALSPNYAFAIYNKALVGTLLGEGEGNEPDIVRAMLLSPLDPLKYAMLATRALTYVVRDDFETAAEWANQAIRAPNAHVQIFAIAAFVNELTGDHAQALACVARIRQGHPSYEAADFLKSFPLPVGPTRAKVERALKSLGL